jgi:hypothetical protein
VFVIALILSSASTVSAPSPYYFTLGARGDDGSNGSIGLRVEIRTHVYYGSLYEANGENLSGDSFVIQEHFSDGSAIIFGYYIYTKQAQWFWQILRSKLNVQDQDTGPTNSVEPNGTWHTYSILYNSRQNLGLQKAWDFYFDGEQESSTWQTVNESKAFVDSVFLLGEKIVPANMETSVLGPVEFRNFAYLQSDGWHNVSSLSASVTCWNGSSNECHVPNSYGITEQGANHLILGTGMTKHADGDLLWTANPRVVTANPFDYVMPYLLLIAAVALIVVSLLFGIRRLPIFKTDWKGAIE